MTATELRLIGLCVVAMFAFTQITHLDFVPSNGATAIMPVLPMIAMIGIFVRYVLRRSAEHSRHRVKPVATPHDDRRIVCQTCGYDLRHMPLRCPECGTLVPPHRRPLDPAKLREDWPASPIEPREPLASEMLVRAWDAPNSFAANLLVDQLRARGIKAIVQQNQPAMRVGDYVTPAADNAVYIWSGDAEALEAAMTRLAI